MYIFEKNNFEEMYDFNKNNLEKMSKNGCNPFK